MAAPTDNKLLNLAPSAGTISSGTIIAAMQANAEVLQKLTYENIANDDGLDSEGVDTRFLTKIGLQNSVATTERAGINRRADDAAIIAGTVGRVLTADKQVEILENNLKQNGTLAVSDFDASSDLIPSYALIYASSFGKYCFINGVFRFTPTSNFVNPTFYINNLKQPLIKQALWGTFSRSGSSILNQPLGITIEPSGTITGDIGQMKMVLGSSQNDFGTQQFTIGIGGLYFW